MHVSYACDAAACVLRRAGGRAQLHWRGRSAEGGPTNSQPAVQSAGRRTGRTPGAPHPRRWSPSRRPATRCCRWLGGCSPTWRPRGWRRSWSGCSAGGCGGGHPVAVHRRACRRGVRVPRPLPGHSPGAGRERVAVTGPPAAAQRDRHRPGDRARRRTRPRIDPHPGAAGTAVGGVARVGKGSVEPWRDDRQGTGPPRAGRPAPRLRPARGDPAGLRRRGCDLKVRRGGRRDGRRAAPGGGGHCVAVVPDLVFAGRPRPRLHDAEPTAVRRDGGARPARI